MITVPLKKLLNTLMSASGAHITDNTSLAIKAKNGDVVTNGRPIIDDILASSYGLKPQLPMTINLSTNMTPPIG